MSFDSIVDKYAPRSQSAFNGYATKLTEDTDTTLEELDTTKQFQDVQARYGLYSYGNQYGFTTLNKLIDEDGLDNQQRYDLQQRWFKIQEDYIKQLPQEQQAEWNKVLDEIKTGDNVLKAYSSLGAKAESIGTGVARMQAGVDEVGARVLSHIDKTDGELEDEIAAEHSDAYARYKEAIQRLKLAEDKKLKKLYEAPSMMSYGNYSKDAHEELSKEDQDIIAWFNSLLANKRADTMYSEDANFLVKDALRARDHNIARANQKSKYVGAEERRDAIRSAGKDEGVVGEVTATAKAAWNDPNAALDVAFESTGANLLPQLVGIAAGLITRSPMAYQFISSVGQAPSEIQGAIQETIQEKYQEKYGKSDLSKITPEELEAIYKENAKELNDSFNSGVRNAAIIATVEPLAAKGVGKVAAGFTKLSSSAKSKTLKALGISGAAAAKFTGEGWEEVFGQIATNLADGKPWDEGVGNSFVMALLGVENIPNTVAVGKDVKNQLRDELGLGKSDSNKSDKVEETTAEGQTAQSQSSTTSQATTQSQSTTPEQGVVSDPSLDRANDLFGFRERNHNGEYINESGENVALLNREEAIKRQLAQFDSELDQIMREKGFDPTDDNSRLQFSEMLGTYLGNKTKQQLQGSTITTPTDEASLYAEYRDLVEREARGEFSSEEFNRLNSDLVSKFNQEIVDPETGEITVINTFDGNKAYQQGPQNENRSNNRDGTENANGSSAQQRVNETNGSGTQSSSEVSEPVSPAQTEATTEGHSQPNTQSATDTIGQQNNNTEESSAVGSDGRTGETDGQGVEQGELGSERSQQDPQPTETPQPRSENSGVQQRTESNRSGETLISSTDLAIKTRDKLLDRRKNADISGYRGPNVPDQYVQAWAEAVTKSQDPSQLIEHYLDNKPQQYYARELGLSDRFETNMIQPTYASAKGIISAYESNIEEVNNAVFSDEHKERMRKHITDTFKHKYTVNQIGSKKGLSKSDTKKLQQYFADKDSNGNVLSGVSLANLPYSERTQKPLPEITLYVGSIDYELHRKENKGGIFGTTSPALAYSYAERNRNRNVPNPTKRKLSTIKLKDVDKVLVVDGKGANFNKIPFASGELSTDRIIAKIEADGYNAVIFLNNTDRGPGRFNDLTDIPADTIWFKPEFIADRRDFTSTVDIERVSNYVGDRIKVDPSYTVHDNKADVKEDKTDSKTEGTLPDDVSVSQTSENLQHAKNKTVGEKRGKAGVGKKDKLKQAVERNNDKLRRMNEATAEPKLKYADEFKGTNLRENQKVAHRLLKENPKDVGAIREAFRRATPSAKPGSFEVTKRGYVVFDSVHNSVHKRFTGSKVGLLGFDFDGNPVYENEQNLFADLQDQHTVDSQTTLILAEQPETAKQVQEQVVTQFFKDPENRAVEDDMREAVEEYAEANNTVEIDGTKLQGTDENLTLFANNQDFIAWVGDKLRPFFKKLNKLVASVIAVVTVGAMTIPTDAVAQQGFAFYTQGPTVQGVSQEASNTINWVKQHKDHNGRNFVVADKDQGKIHIVSPDGKVLSTQNALFGKGKGNDKSPLNTPSGRMQLQKETNLNSTEKGLYGDSVLDFVDPTTKAKVRQTDGSIVAMHRVINKPERKSALNSATANDNYLSHGCINIPTAFYDTTVDNLDGAMVYVLDHKKPAKSQANKSSGVKDLLNYKPKQFNFSFAGKKAINANKSSLGQAIKMLLKRVPNEEIRRATGWFRGVDGKWRFEVDDSQIKIKNLEESSGGLYFKGEDFLNIKLSDVLDNADKLFSAYPQLKDMKVGFNHYSDNSLGAYIPELNHITLSAKNKVDDIKSVLMHEIQHAIQEIEGFGKGSSVKLETQKLEGKVKDLQQQLDKLLQDNKDLADLYSAVQKAENEMLTNDDVDSDTLQKDFDSALDNFQQHKLASKLTELAHKIFDEENNIRQKAIDNYFASAGEVESRNVQTRLELTEQERLSNSPFWTQDVDSKKQRINFDLTKRALGKLADNVVLVSRADYSTPHIGVERLIANGVEGFYDPESGVVVVIEDSIKAQDGLSAEERLAWVAWHELYHRGFDVKHGKDLNKILDLALGNSFIHELAMAIKDDRAGNNLTKLTDQKAAEEALVELGAALSTGNIEALAKRYNIDVPHTFTKGDTFLGKLWDAIKQILRKVTGNKTLSDRQVKALLDEAITSVEPTKAERQLADEVMSAYEDPEDPMTKVAMFSVGNRIGNVINTVRQNQLVTSVTDLLSNDDTGSTGHNPNTSQTTSHKVNRSKKMGYISKIIEAMQDSKHRVELLDEEGEGGKLSRSIGNMSNRTQQKTRQFSRFIDEMKREMIDFADNNRDIFKNLGDKKQVDNVVQEITTALRALTGGNEEIRKNLEEALGGKDIRDAQGNVVFHQKGLIERRAETAEMIKNRDIMGLPKSPYLSRQLAKFDLEIDKLLKVQEKFDQFNNQIIKENKDRNSREDWRGYNGYTMAEAHAKLKLKAKEGLIDGDVLAGLTPVPYHVKQYTGQLDQNGQPEFVMVTHFSYDANQVSNNFTGKIRPLIDKYEQLSADLHKFTVAELGVKLAGKAKTDRWETSTMGKVKEIYSTEDVDADGQPIQKTFEVNNANNVDEIVTLAKAAEYTGHRSGRAFAGGTALEQMQWRLQLTAQQSSAQEVGKEMYAMYQRGRVDDVKVYNIGDKDYSLQKGIVVEVDDLDKKGQKQYNIDGSVKTKIVKVAFKDQDANAALFGENLRGQSDPVELSAAGILLRLIPIFVSKLARFASRSLTSTPIFGFTNSFKGLKEKHNQLLAWTKDSTWVKDLPPNIQALFDGVNGNNKLYLMLNKHLAIHGVAKAVPYEMAATAFAWKLAGKQDIYSTNLTGEAKIAYDKLVEIYERGGISSRVEELFASTHNKKLQFAMGGKANKALDFSMNVLERASVFTMSQELISTLIMTDFLQSELKMKPEKAYDANLHFMNFDKRGAHPLANYLRKYTMFANAIAQGSRAYLRGYTEMGPNGKLRFSKQGLYRAGRNIILSAITHSLAMMVSEWSCPEKTGPMNQVGDLNQYQLMREIPVAIGCDKYIRLPVEYGVGMTENMVGVALTQMYRGFWSGDQALDAILDTVKDNAVPMGLAVGKSRGVFDFIALNLIYPVVPEPARAGFLAFGGVDAFGNEINSRWAGSKEYKPASGKLTTDQAWTDMAESLFAEGFNVTPEEARALVLGPFQGVARGLLTAAIEADPKVSAFDAITGLGSIYRSKKEPATVAYTVVMNNLEGRYGYLHDYYIQARGRDNTDPTDSWLRKNNIELSAEDRKILGFITKYRTQMRNTKLTQDQRYKYNMEFLKNIKSITHPEG